MFINLCTALNITQRYKVIDLNGSLVVSSFRYPLNNIQKPYVTREKRLIMAERQKSASKNWSGRAERNRIIREIKCQRRAGEFFFAPPVARSAAAKGMEGADMETSSEASTSLLCGVDD